MKTGDLIISRWVVLPEMLLCFVPATLGFFGVLYTALSIARLDAAHFRRFYVLDAAGREFLLTLPLLLIATAVAGPLSLAVAAGFLGWRRGPRSRWLWLPMIAAPLLIGLGFIVPRVAHDGLGAFATDAVDAFDFYAGLILVALLPALGAAHLRRLCASADADPGAHRAPGSR